MFFNNNCCQMQNESWQQEGSCCQMQKQCGCGPIIEQPIERCIERNICHEVEHICQNITYMR